MLAAWQMKITGTHRDYTWDTWGYNFTEVLPKNCPSTLFLILDFRVGQKKISILASSLPSPRWEWAAVSAPGLRNQASTGNHHRHKDRIE
jgi:hypothetical protein